MAAVRAGGTYRRLVRRKVKGRRWMGEVGRRSARGTTEGYCAVWC
jgi:hypothetical protein